MLRLISEPDMTGQIPDPRGCKGFLCLGYRDGGVTYLPDGFFTSWEGVQQDGAFHIGRCSSFGIGSKVKFDGAHQSVHVGRYVSAGCGVKIIPGGNHETRSLSTCQFSAFDPDMLNPDPPRLDDIVIRNDVWIGDEVMILGGAVIENGCVIGARFVVPRSFRSEPYGVYAGVPARLLRHRFPENIRNALLALAWWGKPFEWVKKNNDLFIRDVDEALLTEIANDRLH